MLANEEPQLSVNKLITTIIPIGWKVYSVVLEGAMLIGGGYISEISLTKNISLEKALFNELSSSDIREIKNIVPAKTVVMGPWWTSIKKSNANIFSENSTYSECVKALACNIALNLSLIYRRGLPSPKLIVADGGLSQSNEVISWIATSCGYSVSKPNKYNWSVEGLAQFSLAKTQAENGTFNFDFMKTTFLNKSSISKIDFLNTKWLLDWYKDISSQIYNE